MATRVLLSPSEVSLAGIMKEEALVSPIPEQRGADILILSRHGSVGIQRKEVPNDFLSSFTDGRMTRATSLLRDSCTFTRMVCEGVFRYWPDGTVHLGMTKNRKRIKTRFTRSNVHGMLNDIEFIKGIMIRWTDDIADTVAYIRSVVRFLEGEKHLGLYTRPSAKGAWYVPTAKDIHLWILQSFPGIGPATADKIIERFGGEIPLSWTCTVEELASVPRLSKERAREMYGALTRSGEPIREPVQTGGIDEARAAGIARVRKLIGRG